MKLIFLNRYFYPDISATSQMLSDLAFHLAATGADVHVISSRQRYDDPAAQLSALESIAGVTIHRVRTTRFGRNRLAGRLFDYLSFYVSASFALARLACRGDIVIAKTDPPLISVPAALVARLRGARLVNWLQDLFPEVAARAGVRIAHGAVGTAISTLRNWSLRSAAANVAIGEAMARELKQIPGVDPAGIEVIHNWADGEAIVPSATNATDGNALRTEWGLTGKFVLIYSGNMGRAHEFDTMLDAAELLKRKAEIIFLFIGGGHHRAWLERAVRTRDLPNVRFQPYQPRARLAESLGAADLHLTCLLPAMEGLIVPSKIYAILAAGRPTLHVGDPAGEIAGLLQSARAGFTIQPGDAAALAARIEELAASPESRAEMGRNARTTFDARFDKSIAFNRWASLLDGVARERGSNGGAAGSPVPS